MGEGDQRSEVERHVRLDHATGTGWLITWSSFDPIRPLPGLDEILLREAPPDLTDQSVAPRVEHLVRSDLARSWRLGAVAEELGVSTRTL